MSSLEHPQEAAGGELRLPAAVDSTATKYAFDVESHSANTAWTDRFLVEVHARTAQEARYHVASNLDEFEEIVAPVLRVA